VHVSVSSTSSPSASAASAASAAAIEEKGKEGQSNLFLRYKVTTGSLSDRTKLAYTYHINEFLAHYRIADLQPLKEYSPKVLKQMVKDYILHLRDNRKLSGSQVHPLAFTLQQ
jgi:hypothetical protein